MAQTFITDNNYSPLLQIITWFVLISSAFGVLARGGTKYAFVHSITDADDYFILTSLLTSIGQSVAVSLQASYGFGKHLDTLSPVQLASGQKAQYAANLLYIPSLCLSKLAVLGLINAITPLKKDKRMVYGLAAIILSWALVGELGSAFQCHSPESWKYIEAHCFDRTAWWNYLEITNMMTDAALVILPTIILWKIQTAVSKKIPIISSFAIRITVIAASICKLIYWNRIRDSDPVFDLWPVILCTQVIQSLSILSACILYLKPFLETLESGFFGGDDLRRRGGSAVDGYGTYGLSSLDMHRPSNASKGPSKEPQTNMNKTTTTIRASLPDWDSGSQDSGAQIIREMRTWAITTSETAD